MQHIPVATLRDNNAIQTTGSERIAQPTGQMRKVTPKMTLGDGDTQVFSMRFSDDDQYLATGYGDGMTRIYNTATGKLSYTLQSFVSGDDMPVTCLAWRPTSAALKTANILVTGSADGALRHWHATSGKCLHQRIEDKDNHIYTLDFSPDGTLLACAGKDHKIRVYDETTKSLAFEMKELADLPGHSNRCFCVKFNKADPNMIVSGGWDNTLQIYDTRYRGPVKTIYGPHVCGETIEIMRDGHTLVAGSYRIDDALEIYDLRMGKRTRSIAWEGSGNQEVLMYDDDGADESEPQTDQEEQKSLFSERQNLINDGQSVTTTSSKTRRALMQDKSNHAPYIYTTFMNKKQDLIFAGGAGRNELRVFDYQSGNIVGMVSNLPMSIMSGAHCNKSNLFAFGGADSKVRIFNVEASSSSSRAQL